MLLYQLFFNVSLQLWLPTTITKTNIDLLHFFTAVHIGLRFYFHCVFEQVMGITTGVNNTFHASRFSRKLYFIGAELRFVRSAQALPRARPVGGLDTLVGTASNTPQRSARHRRVTASKQPRRKTSNWFPSFQFFFSTLKWDENVPLFRSKLTDTQKSTLLLSFSRNKGHAAREKRHATQ